MEGLETRVITVLVLILLFVGYLIYAKWRYQRQAEDGVLCAVKNKAGRWKFKVKELTEGFVDFHPGKGVLSGRSYAVNSESAPDTDFPLGKWRFLQTSIPMLVLDEESGEPLSNTSGRPVLSSRLLYVMRHEFWSSIGQRRSEDVERRETEAPKKKGLTMSTILWIVVGLALVGGCIWMWNEMQTYKAAAGMGVDPVWFLMEFLGV